MAKWGEDTTFKFVQEYIKHECLWDVRNELYKNKQKRQAAYLKIQEKMAIEGFGQKEIAQKIKNIRSTYSQEKKISESIKSGAGISDVYTPTLKWFQISDRALNLIVESTRKTQTNMDDVDAEIAAGSDTQINEEPSTPTTDGKQKIIRLGQKRRVQEIQNIISDLKGLNEGLNNPVQENEFELFGRNVGMQLQNMPLELALEAHERIQTILSRLRRQYLQNQQRLRSDSYRSTSSACSNVSNYLRPVASACSSKNPQYDEYNEPQIEEDRPQNDNQQDLNNMSNILGEAMRNTFTDEELPNDTFSFSPNV